MPLAALGPAAVPLWRMAPRLDWRRGPEEHRSIGASGSRHESRIAGRGGVAVLLRRAPRARRRWLAIALAGGARLRAVAAAGGIMDHEKLLVSDGAWHRGQRQRVPFETACYYTHETELPFGCQYSRSRSEEWRGDSQRALERDILMALFRNTGGETGSWRATDNWNAETDPCWDHWYGVTCNEHGYVIALELADNGLVGELPANLGELRYLVKLDLSTTAPDFHSHPNVYRNRLIGALPSFVEATRIEEIEVSGNELASLPDDLWKNGPTLRMLSANHNRLTSFPLFMRRFTKMHTLELAHNEIADDFPSDIGGMSNARFVHLQYNRMRGAIGNNIRGLTRIRVLDLSHNPDLGGVIPEDIIVEWKEVICLRFASMCRTVGGSCMTLTRT